MGLGHPNRLAELSAVALLLTNGIVASLRFKPIRLMSFVSTNLIGLSTQSNKSNCSKQMFSRKYCISGPRIKNVPGSFKNCSKLEP